MLNVKAFKKVAVTATAVSALGLATLFPTHTTSALASTGSDAKKGTSVTSGQSTVTVADKIIATGEKYLGTPYKYGAPSGQTKVFDCSTFTQYVFGQYGIKLPRTSASQYASVGTPVSKSNLQVGDLLFFSSSKSGKGKVGHVGIYAGNNRILHTYGQGGVRYDSLSTKWLAASYIGAKRVLKSNTSTNNDTDKPSTDDSKPSTGGNTGSTDDNKPSTGSNTGSTDTNKPSTGGNTGSTNNESSQGSQLADKIIATGNKYLGTPYQFGAKSGQTKTFDCSSFQQYIFGQNGIKLLRSSRQQATQGTSVSKDELRKGDLIFFRTKSSNGQIAHVAMYAGDGKILHTYGPGGVRYDKLSNWMSTFVSAKRMIK
ncbi:cell wall-associated NlpC family hydrolase [Croceifilum oryzae]|uniref:Cell wall-associated NlpC family hydrolase n=1 Tax=Croceifilum oryzae TaxID=1553429 RepID=A0AAJ1TD59_9BACL|nr:C40 family peptidase [Croceifilum oryzae]MDQ0416720.1 cell wall-associated NlpC family hydrolase [Croceifilum oryzae]